MRDPCLKTPAIHPRIGGLMDGRPRATVNERNGNWETWFAIGWNQCSTDVLKRRL